MRLRGISSQAETRTSSLQQRAVLVRLHAMLQKLALRLVARLTGQHAREDQAAPKGVARTAPRLPGCTRPCAASARPPSTGQKRSTRIQRKLGSLLRRYASARRAVACSFSSVASARLVKCTSCGDAVRRCSPRVECRGLRMPSLRDCSARNSSSSFSGAADIEVICGSEAAGLLHSVPGRYLTMQLLQPARGEDGSALFYLMLRRMTGCH